MSQRKKPYACTPPDAFWQADQALAELVWQRHDGATVSTRLAEPIADLLDIRIDDAKALLHAGISASAGGAVARALGNGPIGLLAALGLFVYLERDRC